VLLLISKCFAIGILNIKQKTLIVFFSSITAKNCKKLLIYCYLLLKQGAKLA